MTAPALTPQGARAWSRITRRADLAPLGSDRAPPARSRDRETVSLSPSTYTFGHKLGMAVRHLTTTSTKLLYLILYFGAPISLRSRFVGGSIA